MIAISSKYNILCRSRERSQESDRPDRDERRDRTAVREPVYGVIQTQPRSSRGKRSVPRRHTVGGPGMGTRQIEEQVRV